MAASEATWGLAWYSGTPTPGATRRLLRPTQPKPKAPAEKGSCRDDVITQGQMLGACASLLHDAFPNARISAFALLRTMGLVPEVTALIEPCVGSLKVWGSAVSRKDSQEHPCFTGPQPPATVLIHRAMAGRPEPCVRPTRRLPTQAFRTFIGHTLACRYLQPLDVGRVYPRESVESSTLTPPVIKPGGFGGGMPQLVGHEQHIDVRLKKMGGGAAPKVVRCCLPETGAPSLPIANDLVYRA